MERRLKTPLIVIDAHASVREMLAHVLEHDGQFTVVGSIASEGEAVKRCAEHKTALVVLDLLLSGHSGVQLMRTLRHRFPKLRLVIFSGATHRDLIHEAMRERPHGFVRKQESLATLLEALRVVERGGSYFSDFALDSAAANAAPASPAETAPLTGREHAVLQMIAEGRRNKEIATLLGISPKTAEHHRANLMDKLGIREIATLTRYAIRRGYIDDERGI